jgi:hypothetical protein
MWKPDPWTAVRELARWHVTTQYGARRNALLACTAFAQRRQEHDDVDNILSQVTAPGTPLTQSPDQPAPKSNEHPATHSG